MKSIPAATNHNDGSHITDIRLPVVLNHILPFVVSRRVEPEPWKNVLIPLFTVPDSYIISHQPINGLVPAVGTVVPTQSTIEAVFQGLAVFQALRTVCASSTQSNTSDIELPVSPITSAWKYTSALTQSLALPCAYVREPIVVCFWTPLSLTAASSPKRLPDWSIYSIRQGFQPTTGFQITIAEAGHPISDQSGFNATSPYVQGVAVLSTTLASILPQSLSIIPVRLVSAISIC